MKSSSHLRVVLLNLVCLFAPAVALGQDGDAVSLKVDLVAWGNEIPGLSVNSASKKATVTAKAFQYSKALSYAGPAVRVPSRRSPEHLPRRSPRQLQSLVPMNRPAPSQCLRNC